jgi:Ca-activated chloride channel family protein
MTFGSPWWLLAFLVIPAVIVLGFVAARATAKFPVTFTNLSVLAGVAGGRGGAWKRFIPPALLVLALAFAAGALAHPRVRISQPDQNATIVLLVDVSGSMRANDVEPTRLDAAVNAMRTFLDRLPKQFKVGLVAFSSEPEPLITPTSNRDQVREAISLLEPEAGTAVGDGIAVGLRMVTSSLHQSGYIHKAGEPAPGAIILLSDGAQNRGLLQPLQAARMAKTAGVRIYPVSLGTPSGKVTFGFGAFTNSVPVPPDPVTMGQIASVTGGKAYTARTSSSVAQIYRTLGSSIGRTHKRVDVAAWAGVIAAALLAGSVLAGQLLESRIP